MAWRSSTPTRRKQLHESGQPVILIRRETSPEDFAGMVAARGIVTAHGGTTSHAAVVARGMGKPCVTGAGRARDQRSRAGSLTVGDDRRAAPRLGHDRRGDRAGDAGPRRGWSRPRRARTTAGCSPGRTRNGGLRVRANADTPHDAAVAVRMGAEGIGLCRTEHMFFQGNRIQAMREMILADDAAARAAALAKLLPLQREDFVGIFRAMDGRPVTIRTLDPPVARVPAPRGGRGSQPGLGAGDRRRHRPDQGAAAAGGEPDARLPRLPPRHGLSRDHRHAGAGDLRRRLPGRARRAARSRPR